MTTNLKESSNALNSAENDVVLDTMEVAKLFSRIKENERFNPNVKIKLNRQPRNIEKSNSRNFAEQMIYYRKLMGYTQKQVGQAIGVSEDSYRRYELEEIELTDIKRIKKIIKFLGFKEEPKLSEYVTFLMSRPDKILDKFLKENNLSKNKFSKLSGISKKAVISWIKNEKTISKESYCKIKIFMQNFEENKVLN